MSLKLNSYINFNGNAKDALDFYQSVFGGVIQGDTFGGFNERTGGAMPVPDEDREKIMHAVLTGDHIELMVSDAPSEWPAIPTESNITLALNGDDEVTLRGYWEKLSDGGKIAQPLEEAPWGGTFGSLTDKFGVTWMVEIDPVEEHA